MIVLPDIKGWASRSAAIVAGVLCVVALGGCPAPGVSLSPSSHHFAPGEIVWPFEVWNSGAPGSLLRFRVVADEPWISVSPAIATSRGPADRVPIIVTIDRTARVSAKQETFNRGRIRVISPEGVREVMVSVSPDLFTQLFSADAPFDLEGSVLTFVPDGSPNFYAGFIAPLAEPLSVPIGVNGIQSLDFSGTDVVTFVPENERRIPLYERRHTRMFIGEDGFVAFDPLLLKGDGEPEPPEPLAEHFSTPGVSLLATDLELVDSSEVLLSQTADKIVVAYFAVQEAGTGFANTFMVELFFNGVVRISYEVIESAEGVAGMSFGGGVPDDFVPTDLSALVPGAPSPL